MLVKRSKIDNVIERFWSNVEVGSPDECWPWKLGCSGTGYGLCYYFSLNPEVEGCLLTTTYTHRIAWVLKNKREITPEDKILHKCDNPPCCNPDHLFRGNQKDNMADCVAKGRHGHGTIGGPRKHSEKLIDKAVAEYVKGTKPLSYVSAKYNIGESHLRRIVKDRGHEIRRQFRKINLDVAAEIRAAYAKGDVTYFDLGKRFGVSFSMIGRIVNGKSIVPLQTE